MVQHQRARDRKTKLFEKKFSDNSTKVQSAMEYLMTYGWAILIIAVVLAALDFLGVFNGNTFVGPSCLATPGYLCSNPVMTANANGPNLLSFNFKQDSGETLYNVSFMCAASSSSQGYPNVNITSTNYGAQTSSNLTVLTSGSSVTVSGLECYSNNGNLFKDNPIGAVFSGTLWIRYNLQGYPSSDYQYAKIAKITAKVESEAEISAMQSSPTQLTFSSLSPSSPSIDSGQSVTLTVSWLGGVSPFTVNWLSGTSSSSLSLLSSHTGIISSSLSDSLSVAPTSNTYYSANIIDSSTPPNVVSSPVDLITVNPALSTPSISASSTALVTGQSVTFSSSWTGGTAPYTAKLYSSSTLPCTSVSSLLQTETTSTNSISFPAITPAATAYYCIYVNDSSYLSTETQNSITQEVTDTTPSGLLYYVPITLTNSQSTATTVPFQQMINITESSFSSYLTYNSNFANFEYFYANGNIIPAWIESNNTGKLVTWLKLSQSIAANSNTVIYLGFAGSNNLLSSSGTTGIGEAPQLSSTYAEYDDGASVFSNYWNFAGTSLPSSLTTYGQSGATTVNNELTLTWSSSDSGLYITSGISAPQIVEVLSLSSYSTTYPTMIIGESTSTNTFIQPGWLYPSYDIDYYGGYWRPEYVSSSTTRNAVSQIVGSVKKNTVYSFVWVSTGNEIGYQNYSNFVSSSNIINTWVSTLYPYIGIDDSGSGSFSIQWARVRAYPPNGAMPSVTFGSVS